MQDEIWILEYSKRQKAFHVDTLDRVLERNARAFLNDTDADRDYVPLGVAASRDEAVTLKEELIKRRTAQQRMHQR